MSKNSQLLTSQNFKGLNKAQIDVLNSDSDSEYNEWNAKAGSKNKTKVIKKLRKFD